MLVIRHVFGTGTHCIAPSGLPLLLSLFPGLAPWAFLSRPCGASFAPETILGSQFAAGVALRKDKAQNRGSSLEPCREGKRNRCSGDGGEEKLQPKSDLAAAPRRER